MAVTNNALRRSTVVTAGTLAAVALLTILLARQLTSSSADAAPRTHPVAAGQGQELLASRTFLVDCQHHAQVRPKHFDIACGGDDAALKDVRWSSWRRSSATGVATFEINPCQPTCAEGRLDHYPVEVVADQPAGSHGSGRFRHLEITFVRNAPPQNQGHTLSVDLDALREG